VDKYRNLRVREYLDCLAAEYERSDAAAAVRGHDDKGVFLNLCCCVMPLADSCCGLFWRKVGALMPYGSKNRMGTGGWYSGSGGGKAGRRLGGFRRFAWIGAMSDVRPGIHIALRLVCSPAAGPAQPRVDRRVEAQAGAMAMPQSSV
jgi:hypothetical protein